MAGHLRPTKARTPPPAGVGEDGRVEADELEGRPMLRLVKSRRQPQLDVDPDENADRTFERQWGIYYIPAVFLLVVWLLFAAITDQL